METRWGLWFPILAVGAFLVEFGLVAEESDWDAPTDGEVLSSWIEPAEVSVVVEFEDSGAVECEFDKPIGKIVLIMRWYDDQKELNKDYHELTGYTDEVEGWSDCEVQPEEDIAICDVYSLIPELVDDDATVTIGHEAFHGACGEYHEDD